MTTQSWRKFDKTHVEGRRDRNKRCWSAFSDSPALKVCMRLFTMRDSAKMCLRQWVGVCLCSFWQVAKEGWSILKARGVSNLLSPEHWQEGHRSSWYLVLQLALPHSCSCNLTWEDQGRQRVRTKKKQNENMLLVSQYGMILKDVTFGQCCRVKRVKNANKMLLCLLLHRCRVNLL